MDYVRAVVHDWRTAPLKDAEKGLCEYAIKLTATPSEMTHADVEGLRTLGWSDADVHDATQVIAYFNYINRIADALGVPKDEWLVEFENELSQ
jgi:uncharacterized peroxidase-related enzyme